MESRNELPDQMDFLTNKKHSLRDNFIKFKLFYIRALLKVNFETEIEPLDEMCKNLESYLMFSCKMLPNSIFVTFVLTFLIQFI